MLVFDGLLQGLEVQLVPVPYMASASPTATQRLGPFVLTLSCSLPPTSQRHIHHTLAKSKYCKQDELAEATVSLLIRFISKSLLMRSG